MSEAQSALLLGIALGFVLRSPSCNIANAEPDSYSHRYHNHCHSDACAHSRHSKASQRHAKTIQRGCRHKKG